MTVPNATEKKPSAGDPDHAARLKETILSAGDLPTLPAIAVEVNRLAANPLASMSEIVRIIRNDPSLTAKILRVSNSAFYGMPRRIESLNMALVVLGMREINNLVTSISVFKAFPGRKGRAGLDRVKFWEHSAGCGEIARVLAGKLHLRLHGIEFTAGLLHDIGKIIFDLYFPDEYEQVQELNRDKDLINTEAERQVLGVDHAEIGGWMGEHWALPSAIVEVMRHHHQPEQSPDSPVLTSVVHLADIIAKAVLDDTSRPILNDLLSQDASWDVLAKQNPEIVSMDVVRFSEELEENIERTREFIRIASE